MRFVHTFRGRRRHLMLGTGALVISSEKGPTTIPLSVIEEVRTPDLPDLDIMLTDGEVHRIDGLHPEMTSAFAVTLTDALPEQRDPAGSALVTAPVSAPFGPAQWRALAAIGAVVSAYVGYAIWAGIAHGPRVVGVIAGGVALLIGLSLCFVATDDVRKYRYLTRYGTTVDAELGGRTKTGLMYYFNDTAGVPHLYVCSRDTAILSVTYDPKDPNRAMHPTWVVTVITKAALLLITAVLFFALGAWGAFGLLW
ncbi:hypothetical protein [Kitasatospora sp. NPDC005856]|uniref:hypothetical protein n=1 Tax=Kitasatospora sp. NPDC005856 TaxID=3154566 RepID=UPI0033DE6DAE